MTVHKLKTWEEAFADIWAGLKGYEIRRDDRDYQVGDRLILREYASEQKLYTGRWVTVEIVHVTRGGPIGSNVILPSVLCVLGFVEQARGHVELTI